MLHDCTIARFRSTVPWPPSFQSLNVCGPSWNSPVQWVDSPGVSEPSCRPAAATRILKMEAGAYWPWTARFMSGKCGSWTTRSHALRSIDSVKRSTSKAGVETIARRSPLRLDLGDPARELEPPLLHLRDVLQREAATHANGQERVGLHAGDRVLELPVGDAQERGHAAQHRVATLRVARQLTGDQGERERRAVVDERRAVAVEQDAARRRDRADPDPVPVRGVEEASALQHLEIPELPDDDDKRHRDRDRHRQDALLHGVAAPGHAAAAEDAAHEGRLRTRGRAGTRRM